MNSTTLRKSSQRFKGQIDERGVVVSNLFSIFALSCNDSIGNFERRTLPLIGVRLLFSTSTEGRR